MRRSLGVQSTVNRSKESLKDEQTRRTGRLWTSYANSAGSWLIMYFVFNLSLTLFNKGILSSFPFPYALTAIHALCGSLGGLFLLKFGAIVQKPTTSAEDVKLACFSILYTVNILVSNISLNLVTIPFHQVVRSLTPLFTIALSSLLFQQSCSRSKFLSLIPITLGVGLATYGDYDFKLWGLILTLLGTLLSSLKTIYTAVLQSAVGRRSEGSNASKSSSSLQLTSFDLLFRMCPLAFCQNILFSHWSGELSRLRSFSHANMTSGLLFELMLNGFIAFGLNIVSFSASKKSGALTMTVAANVKQVLTIVLAVYMFDLDITSLNTTGIILTLGGGAVYGVVEFIER